jgi:competence protein ComEC
VAEFRTNILLMAAGVVLAAQWPWLPDAALVAFLPLCVLSAWLWAPARPPALLACGFLWTVMHAQWASLAALPESLEGESLIVDGTIAGLPAGDAERLRFDFLISRASRDAQPVDFRGLVRLSWYRDAPGVEPGQRWRLAVRLKRPRGLVNPAGLDYERWLFRRGIRATGYVIFDADNRLSGTRRGSGLDGLRYRLSRAIAGHLGDRSTTAIVAALAVGDRAAMSREQWRTLRATGTSHLMAISGLHVGLVAGLVYFLAARLWSLAGTPVLWLAAPRAAALAGLAAAAVYAGLAGFALPTQRALAMLVVVMGGVIAGRRVPPATSLCMALAAVLVFDPFAAISAGFWLSFGAVAVILWGMSGRSSGPPGSRGQRLWWRWGRVQWLVAVGLMPITVALFLEYPLIAPLANLLAVPWAGLVLVPLVVTATLLVLPFPAPGAALLDASRWAADILWNFLESLAALGLSVRPAAAAPDLALLAACVGALLLIAPRGFPARFLGLVWLLPLVLHPVPTPAHGDYRLTLLDVGQGLAAVVRTHSHVLVYDAGPSYRAGFDAGRDVVVPFLASRGIGRVDRLIVSHDNRDHSGGAAALRARVATADILSNVLARQGAARPCRAGVGWRWDGVDFEILHPAPGDGMRDNDASCVLKVTGPGGRVLLTGDVERRAETAMVSRAPARLHAEVLVVPHHGSRTSSTEPFLDAVRPQTALIPVGYRNRYRFPHEQVLARLSERGVRIFDTARHGAITLKVDSRRGIQTPRLERIARSRIWRARD